jgi:hypothetical protein
MQMLYSTGSDENKNKLWVRIWKEVLMVFFKLLSLLYMETVRKTKAKLKSV